MRNTRGRSSKPGHRPTTAILLIGVFAMAVLGPVQVLAKDPPLAIRGSSTLQPLAESWIEAYQSKKRSSRFDLDATGSSEGIEDLLAGRADIAMASRPMTEEEGAIAEQNEKKIHATVVARMGIAVIVNPENPVRSVQVEDLAEIFSGGLTNWQAVGGPDQQIVVVRKESGWSPDFFRRRIMGSRDFIAESVIVDSKEEVLEEVSGRPWSIGVTGMPEALPALERVALVRLVSGTAEDDATYALSRPLFFFTVEGTPRVQPFLDFVTGGAAQAMIIDTGFYPAHMADELGD